MDFGTIVGYVPVAIVTIVLGVATNRIDKGIDVFRNVSSKKRAAKVLVDKQRKAQQVADLRNSNHSVSFFVVEAAQSIKNILLGLVICSIAINFVTVNAEYKPGNYFELAYLAMGAIFEIIGLRIYIRGLKELRNIHGIYLDLVALEKAQLKPSSPQS